MRYRKLGNSDMNISVVAIGTWAMGGEFTGDVDESAAISAIHASFDNGINYIDTAAAYGRGRAEMITGKALKGWRNKVFVATKTGVQRDGEGYVISLKPEIIKKEIEESLQRLSVDYIDLYQIHWPDPNFPLEDSLEMLIKLRKQGKYRYLGVSNFDTKLLQQSMNQAGIVSTQPQYSLLNREIEKDILPFCIEKGLGVLTWGSLGGGILTGRFKEPPQDGGNVHRGDLYPYFKEPLWSKCQKLLVLMKNIAEEHNGVVSQVAINWIIAQKGVTCALVGASKPEQAIANAKTSDWELTQEDISRIDAKYYELFV